MTSKVANNPAVEFGVKSQLSKLLATENITLEHKPGAPTAYFDIKNRILALPVWQNISEDLYDMLIVHEVGHALDTPLEAWLKAIKTISSKHHKDPAIAKKAEPAIKDFINVVEDARIDKRQKRRYPGAKRNYVQGLKELHERDFFGLSKKDINTMGFVDRVNIYFKGGVSMNINFSKEEKVFIKRMEDAETFEEVIAITDDIYAYARSKNEFLRQTTTTKLVIVDDEDGDEGEGDDWDEIDINDFDEIDDQRTGNGKKSSKDVDKKDGDDKSSKSENGAGDAKDKEDGEGDKSKDKASSGNKEENEDADGSGKDAKDQKDGKGKDEKKPGVSIVQPFKTNDAGGCPEDFIPQSMTEQAAADKVRDIVLNTDANYVYLTTPTFNLESIVDDFKVVIPQMEKSLRGNYGGVDEEMKKRRNELTKWKAREKDAISFMVKEFEMRKAADTHARIQIAKTGVLDTNKLHSYKYNDDIFRRNATIPEGKNHGFVMVLDWSGSMHTELKHTMKQLFSLVMFCKRVQIPFDVYIFRSFTYSDKASAKPCIQYQSMALNFGAFKLRNVLSSRMNVGMLNRAMETLWYSAVNGLTSDPMDSTPLNQSLLAIHDVVNAFQKRHKVQIVSTIVMTDGGSDPTAGYFDEVNLPQKRGGTKYFLRDTVTGKVYPLSGHPRSIYQEATSTYAKILKERTQSNLIGFYLTNSNYQSLLSWTTVTNHNKPESKKSWQDNGYLGVMTAGYDEYYILSIKNMADTKNDMAVTSGMSAVAAAKNFSKFNEKKSVNRVLLTNFIKRISNVMKKV